MKGRQVERLARRHLLTVMPGFLARGALVYRPPTDYLLQAVSFDTSRFTSSRIFVTAFVQPLFHGDEHLTYNYGFRLGNDSWDVNADDPFAAIAEEVQRSALPFFRQAADLERFAALVTTWADERPRRVMLSVALDDPIVISGSRVRGNRAGDRGAAESLLRSAAATLEADEGEDGDDEWIAALRSMLNVLDSAGLESAQATLAKRRAHTIASLKL